MPWTRYRRGDKRAVSAKKTAFLESVHIPKEGTLCESCPPKKQKPASFIGWYYLITFKGKTKDRANRTRKTVFTPMCSRHWLEKMHGLCPMACRSKRCTQNQSKLAGLQFGEKDFIYYLPLFALLSDNRVVLTCPYCKRPMVSAYDAKWCSFYIPPSERPKMRRVTKGLLRDKVKKAKKLVAVAKMDDLDQYVRERGLSKTEVNKALRKRESSRRSKGGNYLGGSSRPSRRKRESLGEIRKRNLNSHR